MKLPDFASNQKAPLPMWPLGRMALRSLIETPITRDRTPFAIFSSSPNVLTSIRLGDAPPSPAPPRIFTDSSETDVTFLPLSRSNQSLPTIPRAIDPMHDLKKCCGQWPSP